MKSWLGSPYFALFFAVVGGLLVGGTGSAHDNGAPEVLWQFSPADGAVYGSARSADGAELVTVIGYGFDPGGRIVSLDPATGSERWAVDVPESPSADPVVANGTIYVGIGSLVSGNSAVYALDAETGTQRWRADVTNRELPATPVDGVALGGNMLFVNRADGVLLALDVASGAERWAVGLQKPPRGVPVVDGETVFVSTGFDGAAILALDVASGAERWRFEQPDNPVTGPVIAGGLLYVGFTNGELAALDPATGEERWRAETGVRSADDFGAPSPGLPLVVDGVLFVSSNGFSGASTQAFDAQTGVDRWMAVTGEFSASAPAIAGEVLLVGSDRGDLIGLDAVSGMELWRVAVPGEVDIDLDQAGPPLVAGNRIVLRDDAGGIVGLETSESLR
jgi:outer membrane protein assembly factor BamB